MATKKPLVFNTGRKERMEDSYLLYLGSTFKTIHTDSDLDLSSLESIKINVTVDTSNGDVTITLPSASSDKSIIIKKVTDDTNKVIINPQSSDDIDGNSSYEITEAKGSFFSFIKESATSWKMISSGGSSSSTTTTTGTAQPVITLGTEDLLDPFNDSSEIAFYRFEDNSKDEYENYNGTWSGNEQYDIGVFGKAAKFDGASCVYRNGRIDTPQDKLTVSLWFNVFSTDVLTDGGWLINQRRNVLDHSVNQEEWQICFYDNNLYFNIFDNGDPYSINSVDYPASNFELYTFYNVIGVFSYNNFMRLYINGIKVGEIVPDALISKVAPVIYIGRASWTDGWYFNGLIDQLRILNRALTDEEVKFLYNESAKQVYSNYSVEVLQSVTEDKKDPLEDGSEIAFYRFEDNSKDEYGNYNGTWVGNEQYDTGVFGKAAKFDGNSCIIVNNSDENLRVTGDLSVDLRLNWNGDTSEDNYIISLASYGESLTTNALFVLAIATDGHLYYLHEYSSGSNVWIDFSYNVPVNKFINLSLVRDTINKILKLYIDSNLVETKTYTYNPQKDTSGNTQKLIIASNATASTTTPSQEFRGLIDQLRILNRALTDDEVRQLYVESKSIIIDKPTLIRDVTDIYNPVINVDTSKNPVTVYLQQSDKMSQNATFVKFRKIGSNTLTIEKYPTSNQTIGGKETSIEVDKEVSLINTKDEWKPLDREELDYRVVIIDDDYECYDNDFVFVDTSSKQINLTLPPKPKTGSRVKIKDYMNTFSTFSCIVEGNGNNIEHDTSLVMNADGAFIELMFDGFVWKVL